jgi:hypothetical protein
LKKDVHICNDKFVTTNYGLGNNLLTPWSRVLLEKLNSKTLQLVKKFPTFMEPESSSPYPQVIANLEITCISNISALNLP